MYDHRTLNIVICKFNLPTTLLMNNFSDCCVEFINLDIIIVCPN